MNTVRAAALAAGLVVIAATSWAEEGALQACKNHYILRCEISALEWTPAAAPLLNHHGGAVATLLEDGRVLVVGGASSGGGAEIYDPVIDRWILAAPMSVTRVHHRAVRLRDGRVLVIGGEMMRGSDARATAEIYDPARDTWTATPPLNFHRRTWTRGDLTANLLPDGSVLVIGGHDPGWNVRAETEVYDPATDTWRVTGRLASGRVGHSATTLADGSVLAVAGVADWEGPWGVPTVELYDPATGEWRTLGSTRPRVNHIATLVADGSVLIAGGQPACCSPGPNNGASWPWGESLLYDPARPESVSIAELPSPRYQYGAVAHPGGLLVVGGYLDQVAAAPAARVEQSEHYDADSRRWSAIQEIGERPLYEPFSATPIGNGRILFIGPLGAYLLSY